MDRDTIINKVLRDMKQFGLITLDESGDVRSGEARVFLNALYQAAWESGTKYYGTMNSKKIECYDTNNNKIGTFDNQLKASKEVGYTDRAILRSLKTGKKTRAGHYWKYAS